MGDKFNKIGQSLIQWYATHRRILPWRETKDPYRIWVSEIILQQTRVKQGYEYYLRFIGAFPNIQSLALADEDQVLKLWQGLGYYSRARNLHHAAKTIVANYNGVFPENIKEVLSLKGIGDYTAAAITSFAYGQPHAVLDGNVFRVLSRLFALDVPINSSKGKKEFTLLANYLLVKDNPGDYNQAIMDFGALQCVPSSPSCGECVLSDVCEAYHIKKVAKYPVKKGKTQVRDRYFYYFDIRSQGSMFLHKREGKDIWRNLYDFPLIEMDEEVTFEKLIETEEIKKIFPSGIEFSVKSIPIKLKHILSHQIIYASFFRVNVEDSYFLTDQFLKIKESEISDYTISRLVERYLDLSNKSDLFT